MNVLMTHNHYLIPGGEDESFRTETRMLRDAGHTVTTYTVHNEQLLGFGPIRKAANTVWSQESYRAVRSLLRTSGADVLHVQNFFPLISPSIYYAARAEGVPVVQSLRNYRLLCPNGLFFRDGRPCEDCLGKRLQVPGVVHRCYRGSAQASAVVATMNAGHRAAGTWARLVDVYIALTDFARQKYIEGGWATDNIVVKPNFVHPDPGLAAEARKGMVYVGRLSSEKGITTLLAAWERLGPQGVCLRIIGDGPLRGMVEDAAARIPGIAYLGRHSNADMLEIVGTAEALIVPSEWYETFGRVVIEAYAKGTPVIASRIGAIAEIVEHERTGLLFSPGDVEELVQAVLRTAHDPAAWRKLGAQARSRFEASYTADQNCELLLAAYESAIARSRRRKGEVAHRPTITNPGSVSTQEETSSHDAA